MRWPRAGVPFQARGPKSRSAASTTRASSWSAKHESVPKHCAACSKNWQRCRRSLNSAHRALYRTGTDAVQGFLAGLALSRRVVRSITFRKAKAHLLPVRKSDVGGTWLVGNIRLGFVLDVREGSSRGLAARRPIAQRPVTSRRPVTSSTLRKGRASASREEHCRQNGHQFSMRHVIALACITALYH